MAVPSVRPAVPARGGPRILAERDWQRLVIDLAHVYGWRVAHFRPAMTAHGWATPVHADGKGFPDLVLVHPRLGIIFAELKVGEGVASDAQLDWLEAVRDAGGVARLWRWPRDWHTVRQTLSGGKLQ